MNSSFKYLPQNERKKIMLICDDLRVHSGVATVARELVLNTAQHFNWVNIAGAINHPEKGKRFDISADTNTNTGLYFMLMLIQVAPAFVNSQRLPKSKLHRIEVN